MGREQIESQKTEEKINEREGRQRRKQKKEKEKEQKKKTEKHTHHGEFRCLWYKVFHFDFDGDGAMHGDGGGPINLRGEKRGREGKKCTHTYKKQKMCRKGGMEGMKMRSKTRTPCRHSVTVV